MTESGIGGMLHSVEGNTDDKQPFMSGSERTRALLFLSLLIYTDCQSRRLLDRLGRTRWCRCALNYSCLVTSTPFSYLASLFLSSMGFRIALLSGFFASVSVVLVYDLVRHCGYPSIKNDAMLEVFASLSALAFAASGGLILQAVRAEVYTLNLALLLFSLRLSLEWKFKSPHYDLKTMLRVAFVIGLGLANHHLLVVACLTPLQGKLVNHPKVPEVELGQWYQQLLKGAAELLLYVYLPVRTLTDPLCWTQELLVFYRRAVSQSFQSSVGNAVDIVAIWKVQHPCSSSLLAS